MVMAAPAMVVSAMNHLPKLRGHQNSRARMAIAGFLGVRPAVELGRLRVARDVVVALPEPEEWEWEEEEVAVVLVMVDQMPTPSRCTHRMRNRFLRYRRTCPCC